ncbi:hypothetical protein AKJ37_00100 [candidate division MSBL1 archaeon SCGC-AAA259I09]|uniref:UPF0146 protein AKJ37_00100 n=3 Tax=candidate division MSBL1 TaxID=215777 RepID=A0A133UW93_9EURY|nr:hypothetical protein AKJ61_00490 [candidate division MSBL1 archaeon SCGC-AAA259B11]KXA98426.1 hypothetical protein AKJ37_00100 [candidate division MSBL1 archaeon SCGC-AAA259I09]KXB00379.1 hypothetical protein AKJ40_01370 [candidate division MSBL1 archaeon SCGC-AAA259M10]
MAQWISENYSTADKIIEIGIGNTPQVISKLKEELENCELIATDIRKVDTPEGVKSVKDDITKPELSFYENADLIFSIRPPPDLHPQLNKIARRVKGDLLIKPADSEESPSWGELVNYRGAAFYILKLS